MKTPTLCECGYRWDHVEEAVGWRAVPKPGDYTVCLHCGGIFIMTAAGTWARATVGDCAILPPEQRGLLIQAQAEVFKRHNMAPGEVQELADRLKRMQR